jgi:hypothetical protein
VAQTKIDDLQPATGIIPRGCADVLGSERVAFAWTPAQPFFPAKVDYVAVFSSWWAWELVIKEKLVLTFAHSPLPRFLDRVV